MINFSKKLLRGCFWRLLLEMISNYFQTSKKRKSDQHGEPNLDPPAPKNIKRSSLISFDKEEIPKQLETMRKYPSAKNWREFWQLKINYTYLTKNWNYNDQHCKDMFFITYALNTLKYILTRNFMDMFININDVETDHLSGKFYTKKLTV